MRKKTGVFQNKYWDEYYDFVEKKLNKKHAEEGKEPYNPSSIDTVTRDTFFLEKNDDRPFDYWFESPERMEEAEECLKKLLKNRQTPESDRRHYMEDMMLFREFWLERNEVCRYCMTRTELDTVAEKWLFDDTVDFKIEDLLIGQVISPKRKRMTLNISSKHDREIFIKNIDIKYCPMCGRKL